MGYCWWSFRRALKVGALKTNFLRWAETPQREIFVSEGTVYNFLRAPINYDHPLKLMVVDAPQPFGEDPCYFCYGAVKSRFGLLHERYSSFSLPVLKTFT